VGGSVWGDGLGGGVEQIVELGQVRGGLRNKENDGRAGGEKGRAVCTRRRRSHRRGRRGGERCAGQRQGRWGRGRGGGTCTPCPGTCSVRR